MEFKINDKVSVLFGNTKLHGFVKNIYRNGKHLAYLVNVSKNSFYWAEARDVEAYKKDNS